MSLRQSHVLDFPTLSTVCVIMQAKPCRFTIVHMSSLPRFPPTVRSLRRSPAHLLPPELYSVFSCFFPLHAAGHSQLLTNARTIHSPSSFAANHPEPSVRRLPTFIRVMRLSLRGGNTWGAATTTSQHANLIFANPLCFL